MKLYMPEKTISIDTLRRKFGEIEKNLPLVDRIVVTKRGKPFAILTATPFEKRKMMSKTAGAFKKTELDKDNVWKEVLKRKSRRNDITL